MRKAKPITLLLFTLISACLMATTPERPATTDGILQGLLNKVRSQTLVSAVVTEKKPEPRVQIALLLDTSGSMEGLIDQARGQLWKIVNELALAKKNASPTLFEVALYEYGKSSISADEGHIRQLVPLTSDLDQVSESLFSLETNGGDEYCGEVIGKATTGLAWSKSQHDYKAIFIAGNEPFTQGKIDYRKTCAAAIAQGIIVNTIFCGPGPQGIETGWQNGAELADGSYSSIDHNQKMERIVAPQDQQILALGQQLNKTYKGYGREGRRSKERQMAQDGAAMAMAEEVAVERTLAKASKAYKTSSWDIVSAAESGDADVASMKAEQLPKEMRDMAPAEREKYVAEKAKERKEIKAKLDKLRKERKKYVAEQAQKKAKAQAASRDTLDEAMIKAIRGQLKARSFEIK